MSAAEQRHTDVPRILSKEDILGQDDRPTETFPVPEWNGAVRLRALSAWDQSEYNAAILRMEANEDGSVTTHVEQRGADVLLASMGIVDANGERMFTEKELRSRSNRVLKRIVERIRAISGMDVDEETARGN